MGYFDKKKEMAQAAKERYHRLSQIDNQNIKEAINNTIQYDFTFHLPNKKDGIVPEMELWQGTSVAAVLSSRGWNGRTAVLNFASYKNPGGMFLEGSSAQEESLCHASNLFNILTTFNGTFYAWNRQHLNNSLYLNRALYTPRVRFEDEFFGDEIWCDVITCAAPNISPFYKYHNTNIDLTVNDMVLAQRIKYVLDIAENQHVDNLILGAFGCGVFMQDAKRVAELFKLYLDGKRYNFKKVVFAIPAGTNYDKFKEIFCK